MTRSERSLEACRLMDDAESIAFEEKFGVYEGIEAMRKRPSGIVTCARVYAVMLHIIILTLVGVLLRYNFFNSKPSPTGKGRSWSPVQDFVEYEVSNVHATDHDHYSVYSGPPSDEQDEAWDRLITPVYFNISREELERTGESFERVIELTDSGYIASLSVYHELHCLRNIRLYLFRDRYYPNLTESQHRYLQGHLDHCLEVLRIGTMCHGNTAINSYMWDEETIDKPLTKSNSQSVCVKWSSIEDWSYSRKVSYVPPVRWPSQNEGPK
ncbi:hypothetical protein F5Y19DRAFT_471474 [Xylariaceae sp. FL1651]|nr:hypothetical protein F5Y19DRAFT_471474 [Xylariaceae sp. FL1651]